MKSAKPIISVIRFTTDVLFFYFLFLRFLCNCGCAAYAVGGLHIPDGGAGNARGSYSRPAALGQSGHGRPASDRSRLQSSGPGHHEQASAQSQRAADQWLAVLPLHGDRLLRGLRHGRCCRLVVHGVRARTAAQLLSAGTHRAALTNRCLLLCRKKIFFRLHKPTWQIFQQSATLLSK